MAHSMPLIDFTQALWGFEIFCRYFAEEVLDHGKFLAVVVVARLLFKLPEIVGKGKLRSAVSEIGYVGVILAIVVVGRLSDPRPSDRHQLCEKAVISTMQEGDDGRDKLIQVISAITQVAGALSEDLQRAWPDVERLGIEIHGVDEGNVDRPIVNSPDPHKDWDVYHMNASIVGRAITENRAVNCPDVHGKPVDDCRTFRDPPNGRYSNFASLLCVPLAGERGIVGAICVSGGQKNSLDGKADALWTSAQEEIDTIAALLQEYRDLQPATDCGGKKSRNRSGKMKRSGAANAPWLRLPTSILPPSFDSLGSDTRAHTWRLDFGNPRNLPTLAAIQNINFVSARLPGCHIGWTNQEAAMKQEFVRVVAFRAVAI